MRQMTVMEGGNERQPERRMGRYGRDEWREAVKGKPNNAQFYLPGYYGNLPIWSFFNLAEYDFTLKTEK